MNIDGDKIELKGDLTLKGKSLKEIEDIVVNSGFPKFRAAQLYDWMYKKRVSDFSEMLNLPKNLRDYLQLHAKAKCLELFEKKVSKTDDTVKYLFKTAKGYLIESVIIPEGDRKTLCISTQVGCPLDCKFCATGVMGYKMNLTAGEIFDQYAYAMNDSNDPITNIVYMGMGEPLLNYENTVNSLRLFMDPKGAALSYKRITVSTAGIPSKIKELAASGLRPKLALSLHSCYGEIRSLLMPINDKYPLKECIEAVKFYSAETDSRITFEYVMLKEVNDRKEDIPALLSLCSKIPSKLNLIPFNSLEHVVAEGFSAKLVGSGRRRIEEFADALRDKNITVLVRNTQGQDIEAACGQLAIQISK